MATGGAGGRNIEELFRSYLYDGTGATLSISNDIDLSTYGGMTWIKDRLTASTNHYIFDTERGATNYVTASGSGPEGTDSTTLTSFNTDGFTLGTSTLVNLSTSRFSSYSFRKQPKFFDVVTYSGNGSNRTISHNLGSVPGAIWIIERESTSNRGTLYHRRLANSPETVYIDTRSNTAVATTDATVWNNTAPTSTVFSLGTSAEVNDATKTYVAYLFAHNNNDGEFGRNADQDIIKCGLYQGDRGTGFVDIDLGFEPEWIWVKARDNIGSWLLFDQSTKLGYGGDNYFTTNNGNAEANAEVIKLTDTGFRVFDTFIDSSSLNADEYRYIYIAVRRGPMASVFTNIDSVFKIDAAAAGTTEPQFDTTWPVDMSFKRRVDNTEEFRFSTRQMGRFYLPLNASQTPQSNGNFGFDFSDGWNTETNNTSTDYAWMWRRCPGFFDTVSYLTTGAAGNTINHYLGAVPEMIWVREGLDDASNRIYVYHKDMHPTAPEDYEMDIQSNGARALDTDIWGSTPPTATTFTVGASAKSNGSPAGGQSIAMLFASVPGQVKVGGYMGDGNATQTIDCGFTTGAQFVLIKAATVSRDWYMFNTVSGTISVGDDPRLLLNTTNIQEVPEILGNPQDLIDPDSSGFIVTNAAVNALNANAVPYIFYAVAA